MYLNEGVPVQILQQVLQGFFSDKGEENGSF